MRSHSTRVVAGALAVLTFATLTGLSAQWSANAQEKRGGGRRRPRPVPGQVASDGLKLGLREAPAEGDEGATPRPPLAPAQLLDPETTEKVLSRLSPLAPDPGVEFALREGSLPAPRTGKTVESPFPPTQAPAIPETAAPGPLEVLRYSPEGEVPLAPHLSVTFSQPMVPVTSHAEALAANLPVKITPEVPGNWRWVGTKTLLFEPKPRFPMATVYTAEIAEGTTSAIGGKLAKAVRFTFSTPPPKLTQSYPSGEPFGLSPVFFAAFDQAVDPGNVLASAKLTDSKKSASYSLVLATPAEVDADPTVKSLSASAEKGRWLAFRATEKLPRATQFVVTYGPGTPSAEGTRTTTQPQVQGFATFSPLAIRDRWPRAGDEGPLYGGWSIFWNNGLDEAHFDKTFVQVTPEVTNLKVIAQGSTIQIYGSFKGHTTYTVKIAAALADVFGQTLGHEESVEFKVGGAGESFSGPQGLVVLDPAGPRHFTLFSVNEKKLRLHVNAVGPEDWSKFIDLNHRWNQDRTLGEIPGKSVKDESISMRGEQDEMAETSVDLASAFEGGLGHAIVIVEPTSQPSNPWQRRAVIAWVESTKLAVDAFVDHDSILAWASSLQNGKPIDGAEIELLPEGTKATTDAQGLATVALPTAAKPRSLVVVRKGADSAILPETVYFWGDGSSWQKRPLMDSLAWYVVDDRHLYRPGEEVHVKGWIRRITAGPKGGVTPAGDSVKTVAMALRDSRGNEVWKGESPVNALGGFDTVIKLGATMNLGTSYLALTAQGGTLGGQTYHYFNVQEFRRPEFEVSASASQGPFLLGGEGTVTVEAKYYAGGTLPNADVVWNISTAYGSFVPPNQGDYSFGKWVPWWISWYGGGGETYQQHQGKTDASGKHRLEISFEEMKLPRATVVTASATVMDVNRQAWGAQTTLLVHPSSEYVGLKAEKPFVEKGEPLNVDMIVSDLDGKLVNARKISIHAFRVDWDWSSGQYKEKEADPVDQALTSSKEPARFTFTPKEGGTYRVLARIEDEKGRANESELTLWVSGGKVQPARKVEMEAVTLIPDKRTYQAGETASVLVQSPFAPADALVSIMRDGFVKTDRIHLEGSSTTIKLPIDDSYVPAVHLRVDLVGESVRMTDSGEADSKLPKRPAFASGELTLPVPPLSRTLKVEAVPQEAALEPGAETQVSVKVTDAKGAPVEGGEVALVVVDESVLALSGYRLPDPVATFYMDRGSGIAQHYIRSHIVLANPEEAKQAAAQAQNAARGESFGVGGAAAAPADAAADKPARARLAAKESLDEEAGKKKDGGRAGDPSAPIKMRENFNALATFAAATPTDASGVALVKFKLPDSLTRYRIMAVAVAQGTFFGQGESAVTARLPLMVRPSAPRFLNYGDAFELPVVIQNQTGEPMDVNVAARAANCSLTAGQGRRVRVPANDRVEVRFPAAAVKPGTAHFQVGATCGKWSDAAEFTLPVWTPATTEAFATYGEVDDETPVVQPVKMPGEVVKEFGGLEITTQSTQLQALTDALLYLQAYPFECSEQLSSRVMAVAALKDVLTAFKAEGLPPADEMIAAVKRDVEKLRSRQDWSGGFAMWIRGEESWPYISIHVAHALVRAQEKGFEVPKDVLERSHTYLKQIEQHIPHWYSREYKRTLISYALYVRNRLGDRDSKKAKEVIANGGIDTLPLEACGWLLSTLTADKGSKEHVEMLRTHLNNRVTEEAGTAHWATSYGDSAYLLFHSDRRTDGVILEALIEDSPQSDVITKVVRGLLAHTKAGHWKNTQENSFVLLALDKYFNTFEKVTPDFVARAWLGDRFAGDHTFKGRTTERAEIKVPMAYLAAGDQTKNLILTKEGAGRLYYRIGMRYAPASLDLGPSEHGFTVTRAYEAVDKPDDVKRDAEGTWHVKAGARVRVRVTMVAPTRRYHVALVDPLPAGLETLNPGLAPTEKLPQDPSQQKTGWWWWRSTWFEHQNLRDERAEAFASLLWEGVHTYTYVCRATTPGRFVVPPAKAEEMYEPETFGRSGTDRVNVD